MKGPRVNERPDGRRCGCRPRTRPSGRRTGIDRDGVRRVHEIVGIPGRVEGDVVEIADLFVTSGARLTRADGFPPHTERFERAGYDLSTLLAQET